MREAAARGRTVSEIDGFTVCLALDTPNPLLSLAVPTDTPPADPQRALAELRDVFSAHGRTARFECFAELHPELLAGLDAAGYEVEMRAPVMMLEAAGLTAAPPAVGAYAPLGPADRLRIEAALRGAHRAYGGDGETGALDWLPRLVEGLVGGTVLAGAVDAAGTPVAGASVIVGGAAGELAGVWTLPEQRRRGYAQQACHALLTAFFARGHDLAWLSAAEGAVGLYRRLGFTPVGTQVNAALADPGADRAGVV
jgi:ribosomal protein S18 acetylase RimI-like enzyme